ATGPTAPRCSPTWWPSCRRRCRYRARTGRRPAMSDRRLPPAIDPVDLPARLAARPRDRRGLPIPPVNLHPDPATGELKVDFTTINTTISTALAAERRCSLCGGEIGYWAAFLGAPRAAELMQYTDPPGCVECMTWAVRR